MNRRILGIVAGLLLPPVGIIVFSIGAEQNLRASFSYGVIEPSISWLVLVLGALIVAAGVGAAFWSGIGIAVVGGVGVLIGFVQFAFPIAMGAFNFGSWLVNVVGGALPQDARQALLSFVYLGGPITVGALLLGAGIGASVARRATGRSSFWQIIGIAAVVIGVALAFVGQSLLVTSMRIAKIDPLSTVVLLIAAVLLALAAYSSRGGGLALAISGGVIAVLGIASVAVPTLVRGPSAVIRLSQESAYLFTLGMPVLFGMILLATGLVSLLLTRTRADAVSPAAV